jgi:hypothetical protein
MLISSTFPIISRVYKDGRPIGIICDLDNADEEQSFYNTRRNRQGVNRLEVVIPGVGDVVFDPETFEENERLLTAQPAILEKVIGLDDEPLYMVALI